MTTFAMNGRTPVGLSRLLVAPAAAAFLVSLSITPAEARGGFSGGGFGGGRSAVGGPAGMNRPAYPALQLPQSRAVPPGRFGGRTSFYGFYPGYRGYPQPGSGGDGFRRRTFGGQGYGRDGYYGFGYGSGGYGYGYAGQGGGRYAQGDYGYGYGGYGYGQGGGNYAPYAPPRIIEIGPPGRSEARVNGVGPRGLPRVHYGVGYDAGIGAGSSVRINGADPFQPRIIRVRSGG